MGKYDKPIMTIGKQNWNSHYSENRTYQTNDVVQYGLKQIPNSEPVYIPRKVLKEYK